jgi:hypothetical protein
LAGQRAHPLVELFDRHMKKARKEFKDTRSRTPTNDDLQNLAQDFSFPVPSMPGDVSLFEEFLAEIGILLQKESKLAACRLRLDHVGPILFRLVLVREYLHRPPENDQDIFQLVKENRIFRIWTAHEQALAACHGEKNTAADSPLAQPPTPLLYRLAVVHDNDLAVSDDEPLVAIRSLQSVIWTSGPALSGGLRKPRRYTPPLLRPTPNGPRPKPRPAFKKSVRFQDQPAGVSSGSKEKRKEEEAVSGGVDAAAALAKEPRSAKKPNDRAILDAIENSPEELTYLRRSKRARTAPLS